MEINLQEKPELKALFDGDLDPNHIIRALTISLGQDIIPGQSLLFIDEIQEAPKAITALKYFYEKMPELHVIALPQWQYCQCNWPAYRRAPRRSSQALANFALNQYSLITYEIRIFNYYEFISRKPKFEIIGDQNTQLLKKLYLNMEAFMHSTKATYSNV